jgi:hypothetical protein
MSEEILFTRICEFTGDPNKVVQLDPRKVERVTGNDTDPQYVIMEAVAGWSKNKRLWGDKVLQSISEQINSNEPVGYLGHIKEADDGYALPDPQTIWLGSVVIRDGNSTRLLYKGYNLPGSKIRDWVPRGAVNSTSWRGEAELKPISGGYEVVAFDLETIDWSRKGKEGVATRVLSVTSEMEDGVDPKEIAALTEAELRQYAPTLVELIERKATQTQADRISEMDEEGKPVKVKADLLDQVRAKLGLDENANVVESVVSMIQKVEELGRERIKGVLDEILGEKVKDEKARALVKRLVTVGEMENGETEENYKKRVTEAVDFTLNEEVVKSAISEMGRTPGGGAALHARTDNSRSGDENENEDIERVKIKVNG